MTNAQAAPQDSRARFARLMSEGRQALEHGDRQRAHDLWREAALIDPYSEQVWLALLQVLETGADRKVCLENILAINPLNVQARRQLRSYELAEQRALRRQERARRRAALYRRQRWRLLAHAVLMGILLGLAGAFFAVVLQIVILYLR
ncbi:MAG: hypothetical protein ACUVSX_09225 [Aggregatilineales bacterium]